MNGRQGCAGAAAGGVVAAGAGTGAPEQEELRLGFIKLTDMAPLAVAYEQGYFEDEGLYVTLEAQANWKILLDGVMETASWTVPRCWQASPWRPTSASAPRPSW